MAATLDYNVAHTVAASSLGVRPDGRGPAHGRAACLRLARDGDGATAEASLGRTRCVGRATCALGAPEAARPSEGTVRVHCELAPGGAAAAGADAEAVRSAVDACVRGCDAVDTEALCVAVGVACWHVRCDVHVVHDDGGALEAAALAAAAALAHCRRPHVELDDAGRAAVVAEADPVPLPLVRAPLAVAVAALPRPPGPPRAGDGDGAGDGPALLVDPSKAEERAAAAVFALAVDEHGECAALSFSGAAAPPAALAACGAAASARAAELRALLAAELARADAAERTAAAAALRAGARARSSGLGA